MNLLVWHGFISCAHPPAISFLTAPPGLIHDKITLIGKA
jgi:hypothetical protein